MLRGLALVLLLLPAPGWSAEDPSPGPGLAVWSRFETDSYHLYSNAGPEIATRLVNDLELLRATLTETIGYEAISARPLHIIVFRSETSFSRYAARDQTGGFYLQRPDAAFIALSADPRRDPTRLIVHEYVHAVMADHFPNLPLWFNEGLAEFFSSISAEDTGIRLGLPPGDRLQELRDSTPIPTEVLLAVDRQSHHYSDPDHRDLFYAQSWALVHALLLGPESDNVSWKRVLDQIGRGASDEKSLRLAFGHRSTSIEDVIPRLLGQDEISTRTLNLPTTVSAEPAIREATPAETLTLLGDLLNARTPPEADFAIEHYRRALELDPRCARAHAGLGAIAELDGRLQEAEASFEQAIILDPEDGWLRYRLGVFLFHRTTSWERAVQALEDSIVIDPDLGPAWAVLAVVYAERRPEGAPTLNTAETAHLLFPTDPEIARALLTLRLDADQRNQSLDLIETTTTAGSRERREAFTILISNDLLRARESLLTGELEAATARLALAETGIDAASAPGRLILEIREIERLILRADFNLRLEEARGLDRDGRPEAAIDLIDEVLQSNPDDETANAAASLKWQIRHPGAPLPARFLGTVTTLTSEDEMEAINRHIATGDYGAALALLEDLDARTSSADRSWIDVKIEEIERAMVHNRFAENYNRAVDAFNRGDRRTAEAILSHLIAELPPGPEASQATELLGRVSATRDDSN